ncbi:septum site-determining protein MinC [Spirulina subsalsa FACHB-351]|uniref:Probable septum site-determining protein MinC n=1 Tax=Spirulina subsalsa FACHB-351 TaxID=234711 RepID=A0ABT3LAM6_9CYAN|nr:septum site-determining protein MinC [Spirulina subsalsa]MCW6038035.1 septum site-determining protein MinC [Spirulina subsalsa FACHB-351]
MTDEEKGKNIISDGQLDAELEELVTLLEETGILEDSEPIPDSLSPPEKTNLDSESSPAEEMEAPNEAEQAEPVTPPEAGEPTLGAILAKGIEPLVVSESVKPLKRATLPPETAPPESDGPEEKGTRGIELVDPREQIRLTREGEIVKVILPSTQVSPVKLDWSELWDQLKHRLNSSENFWQAGTDVHLLAGDQLLDLRQLQEIAQALGSAKLELRRVSTSRRQTAVAAATAGYSVEQETPTHPTPASPVVQASAENWAEPLYLKSTVRSGLEIQHPGTVVVLGDTNPGSTIVAAGDILVLGRLRGIAHAGSQGNRACHIFALQMEATQLRIAEAIARPPETPLDEFYPEIAYITPSGIRLARAVHFFKTHTFSFSENSWLEKGDNS